MKRLQRWEMIVRGLDIRFEQLVTEERGEETVFQAFERYHGHLCLIGIFIMTGRNDICYHQVCRFRDSVLVEYA